MARSKEFIICAACLFTLGLGWGGRAAWEHMQVQQKQREAQIEKTALLKAREQAMAELKVIAEKKAADDRLAAAGVSPTAAANKPSTPALPEDPEMKEFLAHARVSSILLGSPKIVVINKKEYEEGGEVPLPSGKRAKVSEIREDGVTLTRDGRAYQLLASR